MMDLEAVAVVLAAVVGSTGLASLITGGLQFSRASRVKKAAHDMSDLLKLQEPGTAESDAAKYALKVLTLDLVAIRVVRVGARAWWVVFGVVVVVAALVFSYAGLPKETLPLGLWDDHIRNNLLFLAGTHTVILVGGSVFMFTRRRERLVAYALERDAFEQTLVLMQSPPLQTLKFRGELKALRRERRRAARGRRQDPSDGAGTSPAGEEPAELRHADA